VHRLFFFWDTSCSGSLTLQDIVSGLDGVMFNDLMENIEWYFNLHDKNKDGYLTRDEVLTLSESFLFIFRHEVGDAYLGAVSRFMTNAFEYGDALLPQEENPETGEMQPKQLESNQPYLNLATFRMVVLADEILESFFEADLSGSFRLEPVPDLELPTTSGNFLGDLWQNIATADNKRIFHKFSDELGKTIGKHQIAYRPAIGRYKSLEEPKARESLLSPSQMHPQRMESPAPSAGDGAASASSVGNTSTSTLVGSSAPSQATAGSSSLTVDASAAGHAGDGSPTSAALSSTASALPAPHERAVNAARTLLERTPFAIDDVGDDDESDLDLLHGEDDDQVMDEVDAFLEENDQGLTDADKELAKDLIHAEPVK